MLKLMYLVTTSSMWERFAKSTIRGVEWGGRW